RRENLDLKNTLLSLLTPQFRVCLSFYTRNLPRCLSPAFVSWCPVKRCFFRPMKLSEVRTNNKSPLQSLASSRRLDWQQGFFDFEAEKREEQDHKEDARPQFDVGPGAPRGPASVFDPLSERSPHSGPAVISPDTLHEIISEDGPTADGISNL